MIEYRYNGFNNTNTWWKLDKADLKASELTFEIRIYRIDGIVYKSNTNKFKDAYKKAHFWSKLQ